MNRSKADEEFEQMVTNDTKKKDLFPLRDLRGVLFNPPLPFIRLGVACAA